MGECYSAYKLSKLINSLLQFCWELSEWNSSKAQLAAEHSASGAHTHSCLFILSTTKRFFSLFLIWGCRFSTRWSSGSLFRSLHLLEYFYLYLPWECIVYFWIGFRKVHSRFRASLASGKLQYEEVVWSGIIWNLFLDFWLVQRCSPGIHP